VPPAAGHQLGTPLPVRVGAVLRKWQVDGHFHGVARRHLPAVAEAAMVASPAASPVLSIQKELVSNFENR
jgi:hypothetical protein